METESLTPTAIATATVPWPMDTATVLPHHQRHPRMDHLTVSSVVFGRLFVSFFGLKLILDAPAPALSNTGVIGFG